MRYVLAFAGLFTLGFGSGDGLANGLDLLGWILFGLGMFLILLKSQRRPRRR